MDGHRACWHVWADRGAIAMLSVCPRSSQGLNHTFQRQESTCPAVRLNTRFTEIILVKTRAQSNLLSQSILFARHSIHSIDYVHLDIYLKSSISNNIWMCREEERRGSAGSASPSKIPRGQPGSDERYPSNKVVRQLVINALLVEDVSTDVCTVQCELWEENIELRLQL